MHVHGQISRFFLDSDADPDPDTDSDPDPDTDPDPDPDSDSDPVASVMTLIDSKQSC